MNWGDPPIFETEIAGIPTGVTKDHNQVLYFWRQLRGATLFHVDGHSDMGWFRRHRLELTDEDINVCGIGDFIIPAMAHSIVDSVYWLNPHSPHRKLQDMGATKCNRFGRVKLDVSIPTMDYSEYHVYITLPGSTYSDSFTSMAIGHVLSGVEGVLVPDEKPLVLDVDLDAFCCRLSVHNRPYREYDPVGGWEQRVEETLETLAVLRRPDLITITFSEGKDEKSSYVPRDKAQEVYQLLSDGLRRIYR